MTQNDLPDAGAQSLQRLDDIRPLPLRSNGEGPQALVLRVTRERLESFPSRLDP